MTVNLSPIFNSKTKFFLALTVRDLTERPSAWYDTDPSHTRTAKKNTRIESGSNLEEDYEKKGGS